MEYSLLPQNNAGRDIRIYYQPGFAGHFMTYLFGLDPIVVSYIEPTTDIDERAEIYNFTNLKQKYKHWGLIHTNTDEKVFRSNNNQIYIDAIHPFDHKLNDNPQAEPYLIDLSYNDFSNYWLMHTKELWHGFPATSIEFVQTQKKLIVEQNPIKILLDCFLDRTKWVDEYLRIGKLMNIPTHIGPATKVYESWYAQRVAPLVPKFNQLTSEEKLEFYKKRIHEEINGGEIDTISMIKELATLGIFIE